MIQSPRETNILSAISHELNLANHEQLAKIFDKVGLITDALCTSCPIGEQKCSEISETFGDEELWCWEVVKLYLDESDITNS